jgi:hypothetical protein
MNSKRYILPACIFTCLILLFSCQKKSTTEPEEPSHGDIIWEGLYGGSGLDEGWDIAFSPDGGFAIAGYTYSLGQGESDLYVTKAAADGGEEWSSVFGGTSKDEAFGIDIVSNEGYIVAGRSESIGSYGSVYVLRLGLSGDTIWTCVFDGLGNDGGEDVKVTNDGGFIVGGYFSVGTNMMDMYLLRINSNGDSIWAKTYGGSDYERGFSVLQTPDNGFVGAGYRHYSGTGNYDVYMVRVDENGDTLWTKTFGDSEWDEANDVIRTSDGNYAVVGNWESGGRWDVFLMKVDDNGNELWRKIYGGGSDDFGYSLVEMPDGGFIIVGGTYSYGAGQTDMYVIRTDMDGDTVWTRTYGGSGYDFGHSICSTSDGKYAVVGYNGSKGSGSYDVWLLKIEP